MLSARSGGSGKKSRPWPITTTKQSSLGAAWQMVLQQIMVMVMIVMVLMMMKERTTIMAMIITTKQPSLLGAVWQMVLQ